MIEPLSDIYNGSRSRSPMMAKSEISKDRSSANHLAMARVIKNARWVFISNILVAYWPFSIRNNVSSRQEKILNFSLPSLGLFLSLLYIIFNIMYMIYYFLFRFSEERKSMQLFDLILMTIWDLLVIVAVTAHRIYGLVKLSKLHIFWEKILSVVEQCTALTSERETELTLKHLRRWTIKWFIVFAALGITDCLSVLYTNTVDSPEFVLTVLLYVYIEAVICMHNSSALMLIYFIKILTHGFCTCKRKLNQMTLLQPHKSHLTSEMETNKGLLRKNCDSSKLTTGTGIGVSLLDGVFKLVDELEDCVANFNSLFGFSLFLEAVLGFWQVMFAMYFLQENSIQNVAFAVNMLVPILMYPACLICLCVAASKLTVECQEMVQSFQGLSIDSISKDESYKIQLLVSRISSTPPGIQVAQLFEIRQSLLGSALNTLATYFIVLVQMKQMSK